MYQTYQVTVIKVPHIILSHAGAQYVALCASAPLIAAPPLHGSNAQPWQQPEQKAADCTFTTGTTSHLHHLLYIRFGLEKPFTMT